jgi:hypothetical protein
LAAATSPLMGNMRLRKRYNNSTCNDKVHAVPLGTALAKTALSVSPSSSYLR